MLTAAQGFALQSGHMRWRLSILASLAATLSLTAPAHAAGGERLVSGVVLEEVAGIATYGPFRVVDPMRAALVGITDEASPEEFAAMLRDFPGIATLDLLECPGTFDDLSNLQLGRMIRSNGIATHVPANGSVRSGAVELFIAGASRSVDDGARFAVHAWEDEDGLQATDYAASASENRKYLTFYSEMGMSGDDAQAFYTMTNSVPHERARWLSAEEMRHWVPTTSEQAVAAPQIAYAGLADLAQLDLDLSLALN